MLLVGALGVAGLSLSACERPEDQALFRAVHEGRAEEILRLIDEGADVNARDAAFWSTPLHAAARDGDTAIAGLLIDKGADVDAMDGNGHSPLCLAAALGHAETARLLVDRGASVKEDEACWEENPLHHAGDPLRAAASGGYTDTILLLLECGARENEPGLGGDTALHAAARRGHVQAARVLLEHGADTEAVGQGSCLFTPLHEAARHGHAELARVLLEHGGAGQCEERHRQDGAAFGRGGGPCRCRARACCLRRGCEHQRRPRQDGGGSGKERRRGGLRRASAVSAGCSRRGCPECGGAARQRGIRKAKITLFGVDLYALRMLL